METKRSSRQPPPLRREIRRPREVENMVALTWDSCSSSGARRAEKGTRASVPPGTLCVWAALSWWEYRRPHSSRCEAPPSIADLALSRQASGCVEWWLPVTWPGVGSDRTDLKHTGSTIVAVGPQLPLRPSHAPPAVFFCFNFKLSSNGSVHVFGLVLCKLDTFLRQGCPLYVGSSSFQNTQVPAKHSLCYLIPFLTQMWQTHFLFLIYKKF